jgi:adenosine deaminase
MTEAHKESSTPKKIVALVCLLLLFALVPLFLAHRPSDPYAPATLTNSEQRAEHAFSLALAAGEPRLYAFLRGFPKGADLHMHLSGAIYAETFIREAATQDLCIDTTTYSFAKPAKPGSCPAGQLASSGIAKNQQLYDNLIDSFSMRGFVPHAGVTGHDQFFSTFAKFSGLKNVQGEWLNEVATRAEAQNEQYLEIMNTPSFSNAVATGYKLGWPAGAGDSPSELATLRNALLAGGLRNDIAVDHQEFTDALNARNTMEHCPNQPGATPGNPCNVQIHFLYQVLRGFPPQQVFAQTLLGFEVATAYPDQVVGINFVMPEDGLLSMTEYHRQMLMLDYLHSVYPSVHISLHAGELAMGIVPPEGLSFHIREAVELGHAERIGHGVDVLYESDPRNLLKEMAAKHIMVEVNLTSNDGILEIKGTDHPLSAYRAAHVPFALSTDDEGVSRIDLTHEYVRAVEEQGLDYTDLKRSARTSIEHSFLPGPSLWLAPDRFTRTVSACGGAIITDGFPPGPCRDFLAKSERATQQYELERRFLAFEAASHDRP